MPIFNFYEFYSYTSLKKECDRSIDRIQTRKAIPNPESKIQNPKRYYLAPVFYIFRDDRRTLAKVTVAAKRVKGKGIFLFPTFCKKSTIAAIFLTSPELHLALSTP
ncbi:hypothetical protein CEN40_24800 [Fischerella thermalis CCMEE 5205]|nr:hypothetical protein CEN40_24800 [Fischerella thermalis CCMEE 5205]